MQCKVNVPSILFTVKSVQLSFAASHVSFNIGHRIGLQTLQ